MPPITMIHPITWTRLSVNVKCSHAEQQDNDSNGNEQRHHRSLIPRIHQSDASSF
jgi:hypothetical protein